MQVKTFSSAAAAEQWLSGGGYFRAAAEVGNGKFVMVKDPGGPIPHKVLSTHNDRQAEAWLSEAGWSFLGVSGVSGRKLYVKAKAKAPTVGSPPAPAPTEGGE